MIISLVMTTIVLDTRDPETNSEFTPELVMLGRCHFLLGFGLFSGALAVSFREGISLTKKETPLTFLWCSMKHLENGSAG